jgi:hypothetical protein
MPQIKAYVEEKIFFESKYIGMEPFADGTSRKFVFSDPIFANNIVLTGNSNPTDFLFSFDALKISIHITNKAGEWIPVYEFKIHLIDYNYSAQETCWVRGLIYDDYFEEYRQNVIDIFTLWETNGSIEWFDLPIGSLKKADYFNCCRLYSGIRSDIVERDYYKIDMSLINEDSDLIYLVSIEFAGEKGYFGNTFYTFEDCLLEVHHRGGFKKKRTVLFFNIGKIKNSKANDIYADAKTLLSRFNFVIRERS